MKQTMELLQKISEKRDEVLRLKEAGDISDALKAADELNRLKAKYDVEKSMEDSILTAGKPVEKITPNGDVNMLRRAFITSNMYTTAILELERLYRSSLNKRKSPSYLLGKAFCGVCRVVFTWLLYHILDFFVIH